MKNNQIDRISCGFYDNTPFDEDLLDILNKLSANPRIRGQKLKELAWEYIKLTMPEEIKKLNSKTTIAKSKTKAENKKGNDDIDTDDESSENSGFKKIVLR